MVVVELGNNLGEVQIASGKEVELSMPIVSTQAQHAPAEIALWYYDLEKARWIEEGKALKTADKYVGQVKHFSFWNCDIGLSMVELSGKVYLEDEQHPLTNADVVLTTTAIEWPGFVSTDMNGCFTGAVIMGVTMELKVEIIDQCGSPVSFIQTIGPLNENTTLPPIILDGPDIDFFTISGKLVDCAGGPIGNAYISLMGQDSFFVASNGGFSYELLSCSPVMNIEFQAFDLENLSQTQLQTLIFNSGGPDIHLGDMNICFALDEYIEYDLDGQQYTIIEPYTSILDSAQNDLSVALSGQNGLISIYLTGLDQPGAYPCTLHLSEVYIPQSEAGNITTTLSSLPAHINDYLIGTFSGNFKDTSGNNHTISGSFKSKRRY
jgi:hypothetical protein